MDPQQSLRHKLASYLEEVKRDNPSFSLRALAKKLEIPAGNLSQFLAGKRNFSAATIKSVVHAITKNPEERKDFLERINAAEIELKKAQQPPESTSNYEYGTLTIDEFVQMKEWYYYAVRTALSLKDSQFGPDWLGQKLGISAEESKRALQLLFKFGLIKLLNDGSIVRTKKHLKTPDSVASDRRIIEQGQKIHQQHIEHTIRALKELPPKARDITWVNIPANPAKFDQARELIRKFQDDMLALMEDGDASELLRLTIQLCPISLGAPSEK